MKSNNVKGDRKELARLLNEVYEYIAKGEELTWEGVAEMAQPAVDWLTCGSFNGKRPPYAFQLVQIPHSTPHSMHFPLN